MQEKAPLLKLSMTEAFKVRTSETKGNEKHLNSVIASRKQSISIEGSWRTSYPSSGAHAVLI